MAEDAYDVAVIGGGPGGYVAAIAAAQAGLRTACIESRAALGGTCLNVGCIPSKTLLHWSQRYWECGNAYAEHGIKVEKLTLDVAAMMADKDKVVAGFTGGIAFLFKKNKVDHIAGAARLAGEGRVAVTANGGVREIAARNIVIATGSAPATLPHVEIDETRIVSSTGGLALAKPPKRLIVIGAGYIGLELGSVWRRLGSEVTVVEFLDRIVPTMDSDLAKAYQRLLARQGLAFRLKTKVTRAQAKGRGVEVTVEPAGGGEAETLSADVVLVAVGRRPYTEGLGLDAAGIAVDNHGFIIVDDRFRTNVAGTYAIGDVVPGPMLAHKAMVEGAAVAELLAGGHALVNYDVIPAVVFTEPEVAWVGKTEDELKREGVQYKAGSFPFTANSRAKTVGHTAGQVKVLADAATDRVLGVHIMGAEAGSLVAEAAAVMEFGGAAEDIARTCHAHPTLNEAVMEAASLAAFGRAIHI